MKYLTIIAFYLCSFSIQAQTFQKLYDFGQNTYENDFNGLLVTNDMIYTSSNVWCLNGLNDSLYRHCGMVTKYDFYGNVLEQVSTDTFSPSSYKPNSIQIFQNKILVSGYSNTTPIQNGRNTVIYTYDKNLQNQGILAFPSLPTPSIHRGIWVVDSFLYLLGEYIQTFPAKAEILKIDKNFDIAWRKQYDAGSAIIQCSDIQKTNDGNLAFILTVDHTAGVPPYPTGYKIVKINPDGDTLKSYFYDDLEDRVDQLLVSKDGHFYFNAFRAPEPFEFGSSGRIMKLNPKMDSLLWSCEFPREDFFVGRRYVIYDMIEAKNGDIIACGTTLDHSDRFEFPEGYLSTNGFIIRISPNGAIKWLKLYKNRQNLFPLATNEKFRSSNLLSIKEKENGDLIASGIVYYEANFVLADRLGHETTHLWLLSTDSLGCVVGYPCNDIVRLYATSPNKLVTPNVRWTEKHRFFDPNREVYKHFKFSKDSVFYSTHYYRELLTSNDDPGSNFMGTQRYFREENNRIFEYTPLGETTVFDYNLGIGDIFKHPYSLTNADWPLRVYQTSDSILLLNGEKRKVMTLLGAGFEPTPTEWVEGLGSTNGFLVGYESSFNVGRLSLECFYINDTLVYKNPQSNTCQIIISTKEIDKPQFSIFPNPSKNEISIQAEIEFDQAIFYSIEGKSIKKLVHSNQIQIDELPTGYYILELKSKGKSLGKRKFVKI
jgi:hypothetical protein